MDSKRIRCTQNTNLFLLAMLMGLFYCPLVQCQEEVWELSSYELDVYVIPSGNAQFSIKREEQLRTELKSQCESIAGRVFKMNVKSAPASLWGSSNGSLNGFDGKRPQELGLEVSKGTDKVILLRTESKKGRYLACAKEWDVNTQSWGPETYRMANSARSASFASAQAVLLSFAPIAQILGYEENQVQLRVRGGDLTARDRNLALVDSGDVYRLVTKQANPELQNLLSQTFLFSESAKGSRVNCRVISGYENALAQVNLSQVMAIRVPPVSGTTDLTVLDTSSEKPNKIGFVKALCWSPKRDHSKLFEGNSEGTISIQASPEIPLQIAIIKKGEVPLASLPMIPGWPAKRTFSTKVPPEIAQLNQSFKELKQLIANAVSQKSVVQTLLEATQEDRIKSRYTTDLGNIPSLDAIKLKLNEIKSKAKENSHITQIVDGMLTELESNLAEK